MGGGDKEYHRDYYRDNRLALLAKRRKRYLTDAEYRGNVKSRARARYRRLHLKADPQDQRKVSSGGGEYFTVSKVAEIVGLSSETIRSYHRKGIIPKSTMVRETGKHGWNLYSKSQILLLKRVFRKLRDPRDDSVQSLMDVTRILKRDWS